MGANSVFFPQEALDIWLEEERVDLDDDLMTLAGTGHQFKLITAVRFMVEVAEGGDEPGLVGKVKNVNQIDELGAEHCADSVVLGDNAYEVVEGFVAEPVATEGATPGSGDTPDGLTQFFME